MKETVLRMAPLLLCWTLLATAILRSFRERKRTAALAGGAGFAGGVAAAISLLLAFKGDIPFLAMRVVLSASFLILSLRAVAAVYRAAGVSFPLPLPSFLRGGTLRAVLGALPAGLLAGGLSLFRLPLPESPFAPGVLLLLAAGLLLLAAAFYLERLLPRPFTLTGETLLFLTVGFFLLMSSYTLRLDLFSPLTMKVMKFIHDFVHQLFESMLIPDHPFFKTSVWDYIGLLFGSGVGFWGGLVIWFAPPSLVLWALWRERLPSVAHIRQGAERRKLLARHIRERRWRMCAPWLSLLVFALAVYKSRSPSVEYWDPKPVQVSAAPGGEIFIPRKSGDIDLGDGRLHKFVLKEGERAVRFFVLMKGNGRLAVVLDACSICQPEGYGQAEGTVICYYCKTLIPLETVGEPGGCNPVPVRFAEAGDGVRIASRDLVNTWDEAVQPAKKIPGRGK